MVNWREDIEFVYALCILVSGIIVFFYPYDTMGLASASLIVAGVTLVEVLIGFAGFETDRAIATWEKIGKEQPAQEKKDDQAKTT